jgi:hypothetical protein
MISRRRPAVVGTSNTFIHGPIAGHWLIWCSVRGGNCRVTCRTKAVVIALGGLITNEPSPTIHAPPIGSH